jgi:hypothetical protein
MNSIPRWEVLPSDIQWEVTGYLDPSDLCRGLQVCQSWNTCYQTLWKRALKQDFPLYNLKNGETDRDAYLRFNFNLQKRIYTLTVLHPGKGRINALFIKDDGVLLSGCEGGNIGGLDLKSLRLVPTVFDSSIKTTHNAGIIALAVEGDWFASGLENNMVQICNLKDKSQKFLLFKSSVNSLAIKGDSLFVGLSNNTMKIHNLKSNQTQSMNFGKLPDPLEGVVSIVTDGENLFIGSANGAIRSYNLAIGSSSIRSLKAAGSPHSDLSCLTISKDAKHLFAGFCTGEIQVMDIASEIWATLAGNQERTGMSLVSLSSWGERKVIAAFLGGDIEIWDWKKDVCESNLKESYEFNKARACICSMVSKQGRLVIGGSFGDIKIYDFTASHDEVLGQFSDILEKQDTRLATADDRQAAKRAYEQFARMPSAIQNGVSRELYASLKETRGSGGEDAFFRRNEKTPSDRDIACAMKSYLKKGGASSPPVRAIAGSPQDIRPSIGAIAGDPKRDLPQKQDNCLIC